MAKNRDMAAAIGRAVKADTDMESRFARAEQTLTIRPTGYSPPVAHPGVVLPPESVVVTSSKVPGGESGPYHAVVLLDEIDENPFNARRIYRPERIEKMALSLAEQGQIVPGIATLREGRYVLAAGHYRFRGLKRSGKEQMHLMVYENLTDQELYEYSLKENAERDDQSVLDDALAWRDLLDKSVYPSEEALAEAVGQSPANVNKTLALLKLSSAVQDVIKQDPAKFAFSALYELTMLEPLLSDPDEACRLANAMLRGELGRKEIKQMRDAVQVPKRPRKKKESSRPYPIQREGMKIGVIKDFDDGRVLVELRMLDPTKREEVVTYLRKYFDA